MNAKFRIRTASGRFVGAGTDKPSWFSLDDARALVNYDEGEQIVEHDGVNVLWEIF